MNELGSIENNVSDVPTLKAGHYLCTIAATGHPGLVKPLRYGVRHGSTILVNRQLLIANAFENLLEEHCPRFHAFIRRSYDRFGIPLYKLINNVWLSDLFYLLMKPFEYCFLLCLHCFDKNPEQRIARQYAIPSKQNTIPNERKD